MAVTVLAIGEAIMDIVLSDNGVRSHPGGSATNVALGLGRLGEDTWLMTEVGDDELGHAIVSYMESSDVKVVPASFGTHRTSTSRVQVDDEGVASYVFDPCWALPDDLALPQADIIHTGSIAAFVEPGSSAIVGYLATQHERAIVTFDPNVRPSVLGTHDEAIARFEELSRIASVVKLSDEDARWLYPDTSLDDVVGEVLKLGPILVVVTRGSTGAILATPADRVRVAGARVPVVDTIGAGDSFMSALLSRIARLLDGGVAMAKIKDGSILDKPGSTDRVGWWD